MFTNSNQANGARPEASVTSVVQDAHQAPEIDQSGASTDVIRRSDFVGLALFCTLLFGYSMFSGRPLSLHEARLPECAREMALNGDWLIPRSGGRPWLERPPLPHWAMITVNSMIGQRCDQVWAVRLPASLAGMLAILVTAWISGRFYGRWTGISAGLLLATMYEFYAYACLAEDDIFLAAIVAVAMACFVAVQFPLAGSAAVQPDGSAGPASGRPLAVLGFFVFVGLSNLAKGPLVGTSVVLATCVAYLAPQGRRALQRYLWLWGWLLVAALAVGWPIAVVRRYPDVWSNWRYDYAGGTHQYDQPVWYYVGALLLGTLPWTPAVLVGLTSTWRRARRKATSPERFLWCWALVPLVILSIPLRKHHHYLVPNLAPWAILASLGLKGVARSMFRRPIWCRRPSFGVLTVGIPGALVLWAFRSRIPPAPVGGELLGAVWLGCVAWFYLGLHRASGHTALVAVLSGVAVTYCWGQTWIPDQTAQDTAFLRNVDRTVAAGDTLLINADLHGELDFFRNAFYLRPRARILHNLTFLRDERLPAGDLYIVTRKEDQAKLEQLGSVDTILTSARTRREKSVEDRFTLFRLRRAADLRRYPAPPPDSISTMEAMGRKSGPFCGPPLKAPVHPPRLPP
ncbi:MAG: hypothetical protein JWN40_3037 [Phycisphaerales bacterium]|nr:hypothetical protein [Phycisphaerales bacterium]